MRRHGGSSGSTIAQQRPDFVRLLRKCCIQNLPNGHHRRVFHGRCHGCWYPGARGMISNLRPWQPSWCLSFAVIRLHPTGSGQIRYFMPITSHDSGSPAQEFGNAARRCTIRRRRLLGTGATGIPQGVELTARGKRIVSSAGNRKGYIGEPRSPGSLARSMTSCREFRPSGRLRGKKKICRSSIRSYSSIIAAFRRDRGGLGGRVSRSV